MGRSLSWRENVPESEFVCAEHRGKSEVLIFLFLGVLKMVVRHTGAANSPGMFSGFEKPTLVLGTSRFWPAKNQKSINSSFVTFGKINNSHGYFVFDSLYWIRRYAGSR